MLFSFVLPLALLVTSGICSTVLESKEPKKGVSLPVERRQKRLQRRSEMGDATATVIGGDWTALVSFGDQDFRVIIDTGSTLLWTLSDFMTPENLAQFPNNNIYNADASPSWQPIPNLTLDVMYGDGTYGAYGVYGNENVTLGGISVTMPIGAANETVGNLLGPVDDGLLGMGFSGSGSPYITFMQSVEDQLPEFLFTLELYDDQPGSLNLGFVDDTRYTGSLQKLPIDNSANGWWVLDGVSLTSNGQNLSTRAAPFLLDTGGVEGNFLEAAGAYWSGVSGATQRSDGVWIFPCNEPTPDLTFNFPGGEPFSVTGAVLNNATAYADDTRSTCLGGIQGNTDSQYGSIGDGFFLSYFTIWDMAEPSVSFAPLANRD